MPNRLEDVDPTVRMVTRLLEGVASAGVQSRLQICLSEALHNLVIHARTDAPSSPIEVSLAVDDGNVRVEIFDPAGAVPFDPRAHAPKLSEIDPLAESGRGLALIMECADSVDYGPAGGRNRLALGFVGREGADGVS